MHSSELSRITDHATSRLASTGLSHRATRSCSSALALFRNRRLARFAFPPSAPRPVSALPTLSLQLRSLALQQYPPRLPASISIYPPAWSSPESRPSPPLTLKDTFLLFSVSSPHSDSRRHFPFIENEVQYCQLCLALYAFYSRPHGRLPPPSLRSHSFCIRPLVPPLRHPHSVYYISKSRPYRAAGPAGSRSAVPSLSLFYPWSVFQPDFSLDELVPSCLRLSIFFSSFLPPLTGYIRLGFSQSSVLNLRVAVAVTISCTFSSRRFARGEATSTSPPFASHHLC